MDQTLHELHTDASNPTPSQAMLSHIDTSPIVQSSALPPILLLHSDYLAAVIATSYGIVWQISST